MNPISSFFILSPRGDTIVTREYRGDVPKGAAETFFRKVRRSSSSDSVCTSAACGSSSSCAQRLPLQP